MHTFLLSISDMCDFVVSFTICLMQCICDLMLALSWNQLRAHAPHMAAPLNF